MAMEGGNRGMRRGEGGVILGDILRGGKGGRGGSKCLIIYVALR